jgi:twitching motility protein PilT
MDVLLGLMKEKNASDLHLTVGVPPVLRVEGDLFAAPFEVITPESSQSLIYSIMNDDQKRIFESTNELDFSFSMPATGRVRVNVYRQRGVIGCAMRAIPSEFKTFAQLGLPASVDEVVRLNKGLVLVTGATGSGKSTTLASMINFINENYGYHIMTIEDPIEFVHEHKRSIVNQREVGGDTESFGAALKHILRQDPDVILIGELRDLETTQMALTAAETGHLVFGTLHTNDAAQTINRIVNMFPSEQQQQALLELSFVLQAVFSQQLLMSTDNKRVLAAEVLLANTAVRNLIRGNKIEQIGNVMQTSQKFGMSTMNNRLGDLYINRRISYEEMISHSSDVDDLKMYLSRSGVSLK